MCYVPRDAEAQRLELEVFREFVGREERFDFLLLTMVVRIIHPRFYGGPWELPGRFLLVDNTENPGR